MLSDECILRKKTFTTKKQSMQNRIFREMFQCSSICICPQDLFGIDTIRGQQPGAVRQRVEQLGGSLNIQKFTMRLLVGVNWRELPLADSIDGIVNHSKDRLGQNAVRNRAVSFVTLDSVSRASGQVIDFKCLLKHDSSQLCSEDLHICSEPLWDVMEQAIPSSLQE